MQDVIIEMTKGRLVFTKVANFIICLTTSKDMSLGLMRAKVSLLAENLQEPLFSLTAND